MRVTIKDVAEEAGVSVATVSRVMNGKDGINKRTAERVLQAVQRMDYHPGAIGRHMPKRETRTIGLLVPRLANEYWSLVSEILQEELWKEGYTLVVCSTDRQLEKESAFIDMFIARGVDGIICGGSSIHMTDFPDYSHIEQVKKREIPIVSLDPDIPGLHCVVGDHLQGAADAVNHLIRLGHQNIAYIGGPAVSVERELGYRKAFMTNGLPVQERLIVIGNSESIDFGDKATEELFASGESFTALFCGNDAIALGAVNALLRANKSIPGDVALVGYDDINLASMFQPSLSTMRQPIREMNRTVIKLLFELMQDHTLIGQTRKILFQMELVVRESCGGNAAGERQYLIT